MTDGQDPSTEIQELERRLLEGGLTSEEQERLDALRAAREGEEPTGVLWEQGPVEQPVEAVPEPVPELAAEPAGIPPPDPAFDAIVVEVPEEPVAEVSAEDVEEVAEEPPHLAHPEVTVTYIDDEEPDGDVVSLDALLASPPPAAAESLAPPLPPPLPHHAPAPPVSAPDASSEDLDPFEASWSFVSGDHRVVLHTLEGQVLRGSLANADLCDAELPLLQPNGAIARVSADHVKAIFFMLPPGERPPSAAGTRVRVTFGDGRQISGLSPEYAPDSAGFFVLPIDGRTNTARVWVYRAAARQITVG